ncbi:MAG TPA: tetratricopeptide repeat protein [Gemmatimonadales bacterium]|jgi:tetratricopeptide (TPR) repeat protein|nr:tetratricopeptide repeat protein [Gemmatimonadales bacterium]
MAISEIEKLERRYAENPQGLTFAPLAEVHRKNGDVARALELLRSGLELHPDYIPASIVLGRCHLDLGDLPAAETAFTHVLNLDGENVIALKALADINERLFRFDDAERWLDTLISVDRSNDEARDQLERVEASRRQAEQASSADPDAARPAAEASDAVSDAVSIEPSPSDSPPAEASEVPAASVADETMPLGLEELVRPPEEAELLPEGLELDQPVTMDEAVAPLAGLVGRDEVDEPEVAESVAETVAESAADIDADGFQVELSEEIVLRSAGGGEFQVPNAADELRSATAPQERFRAEAPEPEPEPEAVEVADAPEAAPFQTALAEAPASEAVERAEPIEAAPPPPPAPSPEPAPPSAPPRLAYAARDTQGQSVAEFFRGMLAARLPAAGVSSPKRVDAPAAGPPAEEVEGAPTRPAHDSLSLSSVFGDEGTPTPPAMPVPAASAPPPPTAGAVSFDQFYSQPDRGDTPRPVRAPDNKSDDLDQFHAWLQNLKR